jgi:hypothetical protein
MSIEERFESQEAKAAPSCWLASAVSAASARALAGEGEVDGGDDAEAEAEAEAEGEGGGDGPSHMTSEISKAVRATSGASGKNCSCSRRVISEYRCLDCSSLSSSRDAAGWVVIPAPRSTAMKQDRAQQR